MRTMIKVRGPLAAIACAILLMGPFNAGADTQPGGCDGRSDYPHISTSFPTPRRVTAEGHTICVPQGRYQWVHSYLYRDTLSGPQVVAQDEADYPSYDVVAHPAYICKGTKAYKYHLMSTHRWTDASGKPGSKITFSAARVIDCS